MKMTSDLNLVVLRLHHLLARFIHSIWSMHNSKTRYEDSGPYCYCTLHGPIHSPKHLSRTKLSDFIFIFAVFIHGVTVFALYRLKLTRTTVKDLASKCLLWIGSACSADRDTKAEHLAGCKHNFQHINSVLISPVLQCKGRKQLSPSFSHLMSPPQKFNTKSIVRQQTSLQPTYFQHCPDT